MFLKVIKKSVTSASDKTLPQIYFNLETGFTEQFSDGISATWSLTLSSHRLSPFLTLQSTLRGKQKTRGTRVHLSCGWVLTRVTGVTTHSCRGRT